MLELRSIRKEYLAGENTTIALKSVNLKFRKNEFVSILGPSGCGKTTLLNIIGGLDRYTSGDLFINGISTKEYKDKDWDTYRNHSIGFVFQSYNLIMHLTVAENVELALTLSGVSDKERKERTKEVLEKVGLSDKAKSLPNQLSGGQMQRVAIARALINDPDILLADEPTGALDSATGVQVMQLLKEIAKEKLVVMVTHNPELAEEYSTRIIKIKDGEIISDSNPVNEKLEIVKKDQNSKKPSMSFFTALKLSFKNMLTKKARTILVALAGSIGIIGIALILSMSSGFQNYIDEIQEKALSEYPLTITSETVDYSFIMKMIEDMTKDNEEQSEDKIYVNNILSQFASSQVNNTIKNDLETFKAFVDQNEEIKNLTTDIKYNYESAFYVYPESGAADNVYPLPNSTGLKNMVSWNELLNNSDLNENKYELLAGNWPKERNEIVLIVNAKGELTDIVLYMLGELTKEDLTSLMMGNADLSAFPKEYDLDYFVGRELKMIVKSDLYEKVNLDDPLYTSGAEYKKVADYDKNTDKLKEVIADKAETLKITGVIKTTSSNSIDMSAFLGGIGHLTSLYDHIIDKNTNSDVVKAQLLNTNKNIVTGLEFKDEGTETKEDYYKKALRNLGFANLDIPDSIEIYPKSFADKDRIKEIIKEYNSTKPENQQLTYTDEVALMISSVSEIIDAVSYVLIAFVSVSLIVSSIMIGVITYISVLERTKEIGVLRSIGASKKDISRVFNAETLIIGFAAGLLGIVTSLLLLIPINLIIKHFTKIPNMGHLPFAGAVILIAISTILTLIAGTIPSMIAAKKDPVVALRSE